MLGGISKNAQLATPDIVKLVNNHKSDFNSHFGVSHADYDAISFKVQVVNGSNYFIKVRGGGQFYHVKVYKPLPVMGNETEFKGGSGGHSLTSDIQFM